MRRSFHTGFSVMMAAVLLVGFQNCGAPASGSSAQSSTASDAARIAAISKSANNLRAQLYASAPQGSTGGGLNSGLPSLQDMQSQLQDQLAQLQQIAGNSNSPVITDLAQQTQNQVKNILEQVQQQMPGTQNQIPPIPEGTNLPSIGGIPTSSSPPLSSISTPESGGSFAQSASNGDVTASNSPVTTISSPITQTNSCAITQISESNSGNNFIQNSICQQGNQSSIGISGGNVSNQAASQR